MPPAVLHYSSLVIETNIEKGRLMGKKVTFSDTVEVRGLGVTLEEHIQEIKNPRNLITIKPPSASASTPVIEQLSIPPVVTEDAGRAWWWWVIVALVLCIIAYLAWSYFSGRGRSGKNAKKNLVE